MSTKLFEHEAINVEQFFDTLKLFRATDHPFIAGELSVVDNEGTLWHTYKIEIHYTENYPRVFPVVYEIGGAIMRIPDWHINNDGSCCLDNEFSQQIKCYKGLSLVDFIQTELLPWLANQSYRRVTGNYINGEQGHGDIGRIEFFIIELKAPNLLTCVKWMIKLLRKETLPRQSDCFCGSGKKWRHCHKPIFERLQIISTNALEWAIERFISYLKGGWIILSEIQKHTQVPIF